MLGFSAISSAPISALVGVTASLTGVTRNTSVTTLGKTHSQALTGNSITSSVKTFGNKITGTLTTSSLGTLGKTHSQALTGNSITRSATTFGKKVTGTIIGNSIASTVRTVGYITASRLTVVSVTGFIERVGQRAPGIVRESLTRVSAISKASSIGQGIRSAMAPKLLSAYVTTMSHGVVINNMRGNTSQSRIVSLPSWNIIPRSGGAPVELNSGKPIIVHITNHHENVIQLTMPRNPGKKVIIN